MVNQHAPFAQMLGTTIKRYRLEQLILQQPHMALFLARDTEGEQIYQVRLFTLSTAIDVQERLILLGQVQQAVSRIATLQHPVIQPVLAYGHEQGMIYLVTLFVPARYALANVLSTQGPLDIIQTGTNLKLLASALEYAHKQAITHGNLTASSVFLYPSVGTGQAPVRVPAAPVRAPEAPVRAPEAPVRAPTLLLTDIGIAHIQTLLKCRGCQSCLHADGNEVSHPTASSPQQPIASMTDVSALGALLYHMLTTHAVSADELPVPGRRSQLPPLNTWRPELPARLDAVINTALARDPSEDNAGLHPHELVNAYYQAVAPRVETNPVPEDVPSPASEGQSVSEHTDSSQKMHADTVNTSMQPLPFVRRKLAVALAAVGISTIVVGGGWFFLQALRGNQAVNGTTSIGQGGASSDSISSQQPTDNGRVIARTANLPVNHATTFTMPNSDGTRRGILIRLSDDRFVAFDSACTHQGCQVSYSTATRLLTCPCHDAVFDPARDAEVVAGPAPTPLASINIQVNADGTITTKS